MFFKSEAHCAVRLCIGIVFPPNYNKTANFHQPFQFLHSIFETDNQLTDKIQNGLLRDHIFHYLHYICTQAFIEKNIIQKQILSLFPTKPAPNKQENALMLIQRDHSTLKYEKKWIFFQIIEQALEGACKNETFDNAYIADILMAQQVFFPF